MPTRDLKKLEKVANLAKEVATRRKKLAKQVNKELNLFNTGAPQKRIGNLREDINRGFAELDKVSHLLHIAIVEADLGEKFEKEYYGEYEYSPNAWHNYKGQKAEPNKTWNLLSLNNGFMNAYIKASGFGVFKLQAVCKTDAQANRIIEENPSYSVIAHDDNGLLYVATSERKKEGNLHAQRSEPLVVGFTLPDIKEITKIMIGEGDIDEKTTPEQVKDTIKNTLNISWIEAVGPDIKAEHEKTSTDDK